MSASWYVYQMRVWEQNKGEDEDNHNKHIIGIIKKTMLLQNVLNNKKGVCVI